MKGRVLDVGGKKIGRRGDFVPPLDQVESWKYLNTDEKSQPDYFCTAEDIPLEDASTDTVIMTEVLEYLPYPQKVFAEIYRILTDNGHVILSTPFLNPVHGDHWVDRARYTPVMLKEMIEEAGFKLKSLEPMGSTGAVIFDTLRVSFGYASASGNKLFLNTILRIFRPFFKLIDYLTVGQKKYINTGYFMVLKKEIRINE
jgi:SAM-dependent methyltransferase